MLPETEKTTNSSDITGTRVWLHGDRRQRLQMWDLQSLLRDFRIISDKKRKKIAICICEMATVSV